MIVGRSARTSDDGCAALHPSDAADGMRLRVRAVLLLVLAAIGVTILLNSATTARASTVLPPGAEQEYEGFSKALQRNLTAPMPAAVETFTPCERGMAADFPCRDIDLLGQVSLTELGLSFANDIWGWTDSQTGDDYALVGGIEGTVAVRVADPQNPVVVAMLPTQVYTPDDGTFWRDLKVYGDHAFVVSEMTPHGMQVFDLRQLRPLDGSPVATLAPVTVYDEIESAHNVAINEETGFAYVVGAAADGEPVCNGGLHMVNIANPASPTFAGCFSPAGYVHDTQCVIYSGPDTEHAGKEICVNSIANFIFENTAGLPVFSNVVSIVDVTDKANPVELANAEYGAGIGYSHQGWLTPDQAYFLHGDELDEQFNAVATTTTRVWNLTDLDNPTLIAAPTNGITAIDHNMYTRGGYAYQSNYQSGLRVRSLANVAGGALHEVAYFDLYPEADTASFDGGTWSNFPYFSTPGLIAVSSMDRGLFLLGHRMFCDTRRVTVDVSLGMTPTNGADVIVGSDGPDVIDAGAGDDVVCGLGGIDVVNGGDGADRIFGGGGADRINGGGGNDLIYGGGGHDVIDGGDDADTIYGQPGGDTLRGGAGPDAIFGGVGFDVIYGGDGDDNLQGAGGNDRIYGGLGDDDIFGKPGNDELHGDEGDDELYAAAGDDNVLGGLGNDRLQGASGNDTLDGGDGDDVLFGQANDDLMIGGIGNDTLYAAAGNDRLFGGPGNDNLQGAAGDDELRGEADNDILYGQAGTDIVDGGSGTDTCYGSGADQILSC